MHVTVTFSLHVDSRPLCPRSASLHMQYYNTVIVAYHGLNTMSAYTFSQYYNQARDWR